MFGYFSHLIEQHEMDEVDVGFLFVGHTHCSIDQYFSTLSSAIAKADFIPTLDAIRYLLTVAHHDSTKIPAAINVRALHIGFIYVVLCNGMTIRCYCVELYCSGCLRLQDVIGVSFVDRSQILQRPALLQNYKEVWKSLYAIQAVLE